MPLQHFSSSAASTNEFACKFDFLNEPVRLFCPLNIQGSKRKPAHYDSQILISKRGATSILDNLNKVINDLMLIIIQVLRKLSCFALQFWLTSPTIFPEKSNKKFSQKGSFHVNSATLWMSYSSICLKLSEL